MRSGTGRLPAWGWVLAITLAGAGLRIYGIGSDPFWLDEAHTANFTRLSIPELWSWADPYDRGNPPGYVTLLKAWSQVSRSDVWVRAFSAAAGTLTIPLTYLVARRVSSHRAGLVAAAFLALSGYHIRFSQEARTYALMGLVAAATMLAVSQLITQPDGDDADRVRGDRPWSMKQAGLGLRRPLTWTDIAWPAYAVLAGIAFLFHATGLALAVAANLTVAVWWLTRRPRPPRFARNWIVANLTVLAIWSMWIPGFLRQLSVITERWWVPEPSLLSVAEGGADLLAPSFGWDLPWNGQTWPAAALVVAALAIIWLGTRRLPLGPRLLVWSFLLTLPVIEIAYSFRRPIFLTRTLVGILVPAAIGLALAVLRPAARWRPAAIALLLAMSAVGAVSYHATYDKTAWDEAAALVAEGSGGLPLVLVQPANTVVAFDHYFQRLDRAADVYGAPSQLPQRTGSGPSVVASDRDQVQDLGAGYDTVWLILNRPPEGDSLASTFEESALDSERHDLYDLEVIRFQMP